MIADTSAVLAILFNEEDAETYARSIGEAESRRMSVVSETLFSDARGLSLSQSRKSKHTPLGKPTRIKPILRLPYNTAALFRDSHLYAIAMERSRRASALTVDSR